MNYDFIIVAIIAGVAGAFVRDWWVVGRHQQRAQYPPDWDTLRRTVYQRAERRCQNCGKGDVELHAHHIVPLSVGGTNELSNLACLCRDCHRRIHSHMQ